MDLKRCIRLLDWLDIPSNKDDPNRFAIVDSLASIYGKFFAEAEGRGIRLQKSQIPLEYWASHDIVIDYRNGYVAHGGTHEYGFTAIALNPNPENKRVIACLPPLIGKFMNITEKVRSDLRAIFHELSKVVSEKMNEAMGEIRKSVALINLEQLYESFSEVPQENYRDIAQGEFRYNVAYDVHPDGKMHFRLIKIE
jgi:hypothetical protein